MSLDTLSSTHWVWIEPLKGSTDFPLWKTHIGDLLSDHGMLNHTTGVCLKPSLMAREVASAGAALEEGKGGAGKKAAVPGTGTSARTGGETDTEWEQRDWKVLSVI
jgi:hypothetical protein